MKRIHTSKYKDKKIPAISFSPVKNTVPIVHRVLSPVPKREPSPKTENINSVFENIVNFTCVTMENIENTDINKCNYVIDMFNIIHQVYIDYDILTLVLKLYI